MAHREDLRVYNNAADLINQLGIILRTAHMHSIANQAVTSSVERFVILANELINSENGIRLELRGEYFYFNDMRIRYAPGCILNFDYLTREFRKTGLGTVLVGKMIVSEDIMSFIKLFLQAKGKDMPFEFLWENMSTVSNIKIEKLREVVEDDANVKKAVKKTYFNAVSFYRDTFNKVQSAENIDLKRTKRVVTSIINQILEQEHILMGMTAIKDYDEYTYFHSTNVSILSVALGKRLGMDRKMLIDLGITSLFHDVGKIQIPREILNKPGGLTDDEWKVIQMHPGWGVRALLNIRSVDELTMKAAIVAFEHHMNLNLSGYPQLRNPLEQDLFSRIVSIADQYDAMCSRRIYRDYPMSPEKALRLLMEKSGSKIDPLLFKFFVNMMGSYPVGTLVELDTNELGLVFANNKDMLSRPRVMIIADGDRKWTEGHATVDLTAMDEKDRYVRSIVKATDPAEYNVNLADYFL